MLLHPVAAGPLSLPLIASILCPVLRVEATVCVVSPRPAYIPLERGGVNRGGRRLQHLLGHDLQGTTCQCVKRPRCETVSVGGGYSRTAFAPTLAGLKSLNKSF